MTISEFVAHFEGVKKTGQGFQVRCPAHRDKNPSLSISEGDRRIVMFCHARCSEDAILDAIGVKKEDLFPDNTSPINRHNGEGSRTAAKSRKVIDAVYSYKDEDGKILYENVRYQPKDFRWRRPDGNGGHVFNLSGIRRVPYRLPELIEAVKRGAATIYLCEGEKDADSLNSLGLTASNFKGWRPEYNEYVKGAEIRIIRDHDKPGAKSAVDAANTLSKDIEAIKIIDVFDSDPMPDKGGKDVSDWISAETSAGNDAETMVRKLTELADGFSKLDSGTVNVKNTLSSVQPLVSVKMSEVTGREVSWLWRPFLALGAFSLVDGMEGIGKTFLMLKIAAAVGNGYGLPGVAACDHIGPANVLLISAEDSLEFVIKPRLLAMNAPCDRFTAVTEAFSLDQRGIERLSLVIETNEPKIVIIDPLFSRVGMMNLNNDNEIRAITDELNSLATKFNCAIVGVRHINKSRGFGDPRNAGLNGIGWRAGCRSNLLIGVDPKDADRKAICQTKNNLAPVYVGSLGFSVAGGICEWTGESDLTAEMMLAFKESQSLEERGAKKAAVSFLQDQLAGGWRKSTDLFNEARNAGISERTLRRAKEELGIIAKKEEFAGQWVWTFPKVEGGQSDEDGHDVGQLEENGHLRVNDADTAIYKHNLSEDGQPWETDHLRRDSSSSNGVAHI